MRTILILLILFISIVLNGQSHDKRFFYPKAHIEFQQFHGNPNVIVVPFRLVDRLIVVEASLNGETGNFIVDSGVDDLVVNKHYFRGSAKKLPDYTSGINGAVKGIEEAFVKFQWQDFQLRSMRALLIDLSMIEAAKNIRISGFIGYSVIRHFEICFDYQNQFLFLYKLDKKGSRVEQSVFLEPPAHTIPLRMSKHLPFIMVNAGEEVVRLAVDSGAEVNILTPQANALIGDNLKFLEYINLIGFGEKITPGSAVCAVNFRVDKLDIKPMQTVIRDMKPINQALALPLDGLLGYEFLSQHKMSINFKTKEMKIWSVSSDIDPVANNRCLSIPSAAIQQGEGG